MTFKTKFKIGQTVIHNGVKRVIRSVDVYVTACLKEITYVVVAGHPPMVDAQMVSERDLVAQNGGDR